MKLRIASCVMLVAGAAQAADTITFESLDADLTGGKPTTLKAELYKPSGPGPFPAVVLMHGCGGLYRYEGKHYGQIVQRNADWAERLVDAGYVVLLPDSFTPRGVHESCTVKKRPVDSSRERPRDAYAALMWLQGQSYVKAERVALMGWSNGGGTVLHTIAVESPARPKALPKGDFRAAIAFYPGCSSPTSTTARHSKNANSTSSSNWRTTIPLMIMQGEADDWTPAAPCRDLVAAAAKRGEPIEYHEYPGAYHDFDDPDASVHTRSGLARAKDGGVAHVGTNPAARDDARERVPEFLARKLGK